MKTIKILIILSILIIGGNILFRTLSANKSVSLSNSPVPSIIPTETSPSITPTPTTPNPSSKTQIIKATYGSPLGFNPTELKVKSGTPVRLEVYATENGRGCMGSIMLPELLPDNIQGFTKDQTDIFEFIPQTPGTYQITCAMGIPHGQIIVE